MKRGRGKNDYQEGRGRGKKGDSIGRRGREEEGRTMVNRKEGMIKREIGWKWIKRKERWSGRTER